MKRIILLIVMIVCSGFLSACSRSMGSLEKTISQLVVRPESGPAYIYVPFDVPSGTKSLSVILDYDKQDGKNRLELGVFDERFSGKTPDKNGFRGWSGSVREGFFISEEEATHGYQKGVIKSGKWYVILGVAAVEDAGVTANLRITFDRIPEGLSARFEEESEKNFKHESIKSDSDGRWFKGDLHAHSFHSDGKWSVKGLLDSAQSRGLDFLSITDHNTMSHHSEIDSFANQYPKMLVLKGEEVTTYGGHINVWGLKTGEWVDFRVRPDEPESAKRIAAEAHNFGALASINHPTMDCGGCSWTYGDWTNADAVEIWNAAWDEQDEEALKLWDELLQKGVRITAIGSSDTHQPPYEPSEYPTNRAAGSPTVFVKADSLTKENIFAGIKAGRVYVAEDPAKELETTVFKGSGPADSVYADGGVRLSLRLAGFLEGSEVRVISNTQGGKPQTWKRQLSYSASEFETTVQGNGPGYLRVEVRNPDGTMAAFGNPIWVGTD